MSNSALRFHTVPPSTLMNEKLWANRSFHTSFFWRSICQNRFETVMTRHATLTLTLTGALGWTPAELPVYSAVIAKRPKLRQINPDGHPRRFRAASVSGRFTASPAGSPGLNAGCRPMRNGSLHLSFGDPARPIYFLTIHPAHRPMEN